MTFRADKLPPPPKTESFTELYRWNYRIFELMNAIQSLIAVGVGNTPIGLITATNLQAALSQINTFFNTLPLSISIISTNTTLDTQGIIIVTNGSIIALPSAITHPAKQYNIIRSGPSTVPIVTTAGQTISGDASLDLTSQWDSVVVVSDGSNWVRCS